MSREMSEVDKLQAAARLRRISEEDNVGIIEYVKPGNIEDWLSDKLRSRCFSDILETITTETTDRTP